MLWNQWAWFVVVGVLLVLRLAGRYGEVGNVVTIIMIALTIGLFGLTVYGLYKEGTGAADVTVKRVFTELRTPLVVVAAFTYVLYLGLLGFPWVT